MAENLPRVRSTAQEIDPTSVSADGFDGGTGAAVEMRLHRWDGKNPMKPSSTKTLITALRILAVEIQSGDGVANAAIAEAADRLEKYSVTMQQVTRHCQDVTCREYPENSHYVQAVERIRDDIDW